MKLFELPFAKIILLRDDIAEVIINDGITMDLAMVEAYHSFLLSHLTSPFSLLINKTNSYSYDFEAQEQLASLKEINVMAVVSYHRSTTIATEALVIYPRTVEWNLKVFSNRDDALTWVVSKQSKCNKAD